MSRRIRVNVRLGGDQLLKALVLAGQVLVLVSLATPWIPLHALAFAAATCLALAVHASGRLRLASLAVLAVDAAVAAAALLVLEPWYLSFGLVAHKAYPAPCLAGWLLIALVTSLACYGLARGGARRALAAVAVGSVAYLVVVLALVVMPVYNVEVAGTAAVVKVDGLPEVDTSALRLVPMSVGIRYALDSLQYPRHTVPRLRSV